jgi:hypothetical protein
MKIGTHNNENKIYLNFYLKQDHMFSSLRHFIHICLLLFIFLVGCSRDENGSKTVIQGSGEFIHLNTAGRINPKTMFLTCYEEHQKSWLFYGNEDRNELIIYEIPSGRVERKIKFENRGPNGIGMYKGALVQNFDSIFVLSNTYYQDFFLIDTTGTVMRKYTINPIESEDFYPSLLGVYCHFSQVNVLKNNRINLSTYMMRIIPNENLYREDICLTYDISLGELVSRTKYPKFDDTYRTELGYYSRAYNGREFIYSFRRLDDIYIQNEDGAYSTYPCPSKFQNHNLDWILNRMDPVEIQKERFVQNPTYGSIMYDKYRKLIYRIYLPGYKLKQGESADTYYNYPAVFSIMILDENFNVVGETLMPPKTYDPLMAFIEKDGLYFALHPDNPVYNPDSLAFEKMLITNN